MAFLYVLGFFLGLCLLLLALYVGVILFFKWMTGRHPELQSLKNPILKGGAMLSNWPLFLQNSALVGFRKNHLIALAVMIILMALLLTAVQFNLFGISHWFG